MNRAIVVILISASVVCTALIITYWVLSYQFNRNALTHVLRILPEKISSFEGQNIKPIKCVVAHSINWGEPKKSEYELVTRKAQECFATSVELKFSTLDFFRNSYEAMIITSIPDLDLQHYINAPSDDFLQHQGFPGKLFPIYRNSPMDTGQSKVELVFQNSEVSVFYLKGS